MTLWIVVALCFLRSLRCFLRISLFSSVASIFSLAVVGVSRFLLFSMKFFVSSENLLFLLVLLFHFLPAPISGSVMLLFISFKEMLLLLSSCCSSRAAYRFCRSTIIYATQTKTCRKIINPKKCFCFMPLTCYKPLKMSQDIVN